MILSHELYILFNMVIQYDVSIRLDEIRNFYCVGLDLQTNQMELLDKVIEVKISG